MGCILKEVGRENKRIRSSGGATSERTISYGIMDMSIKNTCWGKPLAE
jgi:hypothetical protein